MAKKIKLPLKMTDSAQVRALEELGEHGVGWNLKAANSGNAQEQFSLYLYYAKKARNSWSGYFNWYPIETYDGDDACVLALKFLYASAKGGYAKAQYELGIQFENVDSIFPVESLDSVFMYTTSPFYHRRKFALEWYQKAAEQGYAPAELKLREYHI